MTRNILSLLLALLLFSSVASPALKADDSSSFELTAQEIDYLDSLRNKDITIAITSELVSFETKNGSFGLLSPLLNLLTDKWGLNVKTVNTGWAEGFRKLDSGEADIVGLAILSKKRKEMYFSTEPLYISSVSIYTRTSDPLIDITNLGGNTIGLVSDSVLPELLSQYIMEDTGIKYYESLDDLFTALREKEINCVVTALCAQNELLRYPEISRELDVKTTSPSQVLYAKKDELGTLVGIINRYLLSPDGAGLLDDINNARNESIIEKTKEFYTEEIEYLNTHYTALPVYDSGAMYPFHFARGGVYEGIQADINDTFHKLTGMSIEVVPSSMFSEGFLSAIEMIESGEIVGATSIYYNKSYDNMPGFIYSVPVYSDKLGFFSLSELESVSGLRVSTTPFAEPYVDWLTIAGEAPAIHGDRMKMLRSLQTGEADVIFVSEMSVDYSYTILGDRSLVRALPIDAKANIHMIAGSGHDIFVKLFNAAYFLEKAINPQGESKWRDATQNDKYELFRVRSQLQQYQGTLIAASIFIIFALISLLIVIIFNFRKFSNYDRQISKMLSTQKNADMLWGNMRTRKLISKSGFNLFRAWGHKILDFSTDDNFYNSFKEDIDRIDEENKPYHTSEKTYFINGDAHYVRHYTHKINKDEFMVLALDITDEKQREESLYELATTDSLTGLLTRRAMERELETLIELNCEDNGKLFAMMADIDDFKKINDSYGHIIGDKTLIAVSQAIKSSLPDSSVSRWGGEEFLIVSSYPDSGEALAAANHMLKEISKKIIPVGKRTSFSVTVSCGIAQIDGSGKYEKAIAQADKELYRAKEAGKNCVKYGGR